MEKNLITGTAWCFGDNINTDLIYPGRYLTITEPQEMGKYALAGVDENFGKNVQQGDIIIAGSNFGSGSSREQAAIAVKYAGISAVFASSFARIFFRNIINQGVPAYNSKDALKIISTGDRIKIDQKNGILTNLANNETCTFEPLPDFLMEIINNGGNIPHLRKKLGL